MKNPFSYIYVYQLLITWLCEFDTLDLTYNAIPAINFCLFDHENWPFFSSLMMPFPWKLSILQSTMAGYYFSYCWQLIISCFIFFFMLYLDFQGNSVSTTKYSVLTFLPKGLFEQVLIHYFCSSRILPMKQRHYFCILNFICATELNFSFHFLFNKY